VTLTLRTHKMLWGRSGNRCAICRHELVADATHADDPAVLGEAAHIVAREPDGPRGTSSLSDEQRDRYENLILLCPNDHTLIDSQVATWPIDRLAEQKQAHEEWVRNSLTGYDPTLQEADERYAAIVGEWEARLDIASWRAWSSHLLSPTPSLPASRDRAWEDCRVWLLSRVWPRRHEHLEQAFENFRQVLEALHSTMREHLVPIHGGVTLITERFYQLPEWDPPLYSERLRAFEAHVDKVHDLMRELTRAANYVATTVRLCLQPTYRCDDGVILCESGPNGIRGSFDIERLEYPSNELHGIPFARRKARNI
jgi:hypothetical protein